MTGLIRNLFTARTSGTMLKGMDPKSDQWTSEGGEMEGENALTLRRRVLSGEISPKKKHI
jgi:hypothetical protein